MPSRSTWPSTAAVGRRPVNASGAPDPDADDSGRERPSPRWLHRLEDLLLSAALLTLVVLAPLQLALRNLLDTGLAWVDPFLRVLVLWLGLLGALAATRGNRHINVDVLTRWLPLRARAGVGICTSLFAATVSGLIAFHSGRFVVGERAFGSLAFSGIPSWWLEVVIPLTFAGIAARYAVLALHDGRWLLTGRRRVG